MARITNGYNFTGTIGDFCFYFSDGKIVARKIHRHTSEELKQGEAFENTRLINKEFAVCAGLGALCARSFVPSFPYMKPWCVGASITGVLKKIQSFAPGAKGSRSILPAVYGVSALGKEFNKNFLFADVCRFGFNDFLSDDGFSFGISTDSFLPASGLVVPTGADYFRLVLLSFTVPALCYNADKKDFDNISGLPVPVAVWGFSPFVPMALKKSTSLSLKINFKDLADKTNDSARLVCIGLELYSGAINNLSLLDGKQCLRVIKVV